jgi:hypothetical protein
MMQTFALILCAGRSLGKRCRPVVLPVKIGPTLPARGAADVLRSRPVADVLPVVLPARQLPAGCPHAPGRSLGEALPAPWCCRSRSAPRSRPRGAADVLRCRSTPGRVAPTLPAGHSGKRCRPRGAAGQDRPHAPGPCCRRAALPVTREALPAPVVLPVKIGPTLPADCPTCCPWCCRPVAPRSRPVTRGSVAGPFGGNGCAARGCAGQVGQDGRADCDDRAGCAGGHSGSLTVLESSPGKPCAGFSRAGGSGESGDFNGG